MNKSLKILELAVKVVTKGYASSENTETSTLEAIKRVSKELNKIEIILKNERF